MTVPGIGLLANAMFECRTIAEGMQLAELLAKACPSPARQLTGLIELILNAIEHGNLEIDFDSKAALLERGEWLNEIERRSELPPFATRRVRVLFERAPHEIRITIKDEGPGFDVTRFMKAEFAELAGLNGRGISIARSMSFDSLEYKGTGAEVCVRIRSGSGDGPCGASTPAGDAPLVSRRPSHKAGDGLSEPKLGRSKPIILVADDEPVTRMLLLGALREVCDVMLAVDGEDALEKYEERRPDLILVDVHMPRLTGCEVCEHIRAREIDERTPILLMSAQDDEALVLDGLSRGADDFIVKPYNQRVLLSKMHAHLLGKNKRDTLAFQRERLLELQRATAHEHFVAQAVLKNILGRAELNHRSIKYLMTAMSGFEGDVALVAKLPTGGVRVMVSDVVGHGLSAALGTIPISLLFFSTTRQGVELGRAMEEINRELCGVLPVGLFAAGAAFEVSPDGHKLRVWNGGLPDLMLRRHKSRELVRFVSQNLPIGIVATDSAIVQEAEVQTGDVVFAMSDGVIETRNAEGTLFGIERVVETLTAERPIATLFEDLRTALSRFGKGRQEDDITLLAHTIGA